MNIPKITSQIGGYMLYWEDTALSVKVARLDVHSDGRVTGELQITNNSKGSPLILLPSSQINFSAERTRSQFAKQLKEKFPANKINWIELFDYLGHKVQELARTGEPVQEIFAEDDVQPPEFLLKPFIYKGVSNIIYGEKGVKKSTLAYFLGACMNLSWADNPLDLEVPERGITSLVLDWETDEYLFKWYISQMKRGMLPDSTFSLQYRKCRLPLTEELESIEKMIADTGAELLIIDSLAAAAGGESAELKGSQSALSFNAALRKLGKTSLIIAQTSKDTQSQRKTIYGSVIFTYYARNIFELCRGEDNYEDIQHLAVFHRECNLGRKHPPIGIKVTHDEANRSVKLEREPVSVAEFAAKLKTNVRILDALKKGAMSVDELVKRLELTENNISVTISRLKKAGKVVKVEGDRWGLLTKDVM